MRTRKSVPVLPAKRALRSSAPKTLNSLREEYEAAPLGARLPAKVAAAGMGLSPLTLEAWRSRGKAGPSYMKLGALVLYVKRDVEAFIEQTAEVYQ